MSVCVCERERGGGRENLNLRSKTEIFDREKWQFDALVDQKGSKKFSDYVSFCVVY